MQYANLRGWDMSSKKRRRSRDVRPEYTTTPTPGGRLTQVRNPQRAGERFNFGERVSWGDEEAIYLGVDPTDGTLAIVRLDDGALSKWPAALAGMRRVGRSDLDISSVLGLPHGTSSEQREPSEELTRPDFGPETTATGYYDEVEMALEDMTNTVQDVIDETLPGPRKVRR
jgi:hypothetical protein